MKSILTLLSALCLLIIPAMAQESVELTGTYQTMVACHDTHHVELAQLVIPGKDKFSGVRHVLNLTEGQRARLQSGMKLNVKGQRKAATTRQMTKAQIRRQMFDHMTKRVGVPPVCKEMDAIISKLKTGKKGAKAACGHDHGELEMVTAADDHDMVQVVIPAHIEVVELIVLEGGKR